MNNFDRIHQELSRQAAELASEVNMEPARFLQIVMELVNAEDEHRIARTNINQQAEQILLNAAILADAEKGG